MDRLLDTAAPDLSISSGRIARVARDSILHCAMVDCDLHAWMIMPNHVHMLVTPLTKVPSFLRPLKGYSARQANKLLDRAGHAFWQDESYDHLVESAQEFRNIERSIVNNPVNADLIEEIEALSLVQCCSCEIELGRTWRSAADVDVCPTPAAMLRVNL